MTNNKLKKWQENKKVMDDWDIQSDIKEGEVELEDLLKTVRRFRV
jgi:hypothetical protein